METKQLETVKKSGKFWKVLLNVLFIAVLLGFTVFLVLSKQELPQIWHYMKQANPWWLVGGVVLLAIFVGCESVILYHLFRRLRVQAQFRRCLTYSYVGFFFSSVTPSASGGQPVQLVWMKRDGLDFGVSSLVLLVVTLAYKAALIILSLVFFLFNTRFVLSHLGFMLYVFILGLILNIAFCVFLAIVIFKPEPARKAATWILNVLCKLRLVRNKEAAANKLDQDLAHYSRGAGLLLGRQKLLWEVLGITLFQRFCFFAITYMVYRAFGLSGTGFFQIISLQVILSLALDILPFPGGIGANEGGFLVMYTAIFGELLVVPGMLLSRGINYYLLVIVGALVTAISYLLGQRRLEKQKKERRMKQC